MLVIDGLRLTWDFVVCKKVSTRVLQTERQRKRQIDRQTDKQRQRKAV